MPDSSNTPIELDLQTVESPSPILSLATRPVGEDLMQTVDARRLHEFLEIGKDFTNWIKGRISKYGFVENVDFGVYAQTGENLQGGRPTREYALTLGMAKELAMVERNQKGKEARLYFLECERVAKSTPVDPIAVLNDPSAMRGLLLTYSEKVIALEHRVESDAPKVAAYERISDTEGSFCITDAAKTLQVQPKALFAFLHSHRWVYTRQGDHARIAYQDKLASGLLEHKTTTVERSDGSEKTATQVRVTTKGLARLAREFEPVARAA